MKQAAGSPAGARVGPGDDRRSNPLLFSERHKYNKDVAQLKRWQTHIQESKTTAERTTVRFLENDKDAFKAPELTTLPETVAPEVPDIPLDTDANTSAQLQLSYNRSLAEYNKEVSDRARYQATLVANFVKMSETYEANQQAGWIWLRKYVNPSRLTTIRVALDNTEDCQKVFKNLLEFSTEEVALSTNLERKRLLARVNALYLDPRIRSSGALAEWFTKLEEYALAANLDDESITRKVRQQVTGIQYIAADNIRRAKFDMHQLEGLEQDKTYGELKPLLLVAYQTFVTMVAVHSHTGKVVHELTEVRQAVEVEDKARAAAYYRTYLDPTLAEDIAVICGTVNVIQKPSDTNTTIKKQGGHTTGTKNPGKSDRERKCLRCFQAWHPITECEAEKCATCASLHAVQHKDPRCPIFKYAVRYYIAHGELPKSQTFFPLFGVPEAVYKLCFPKSGKLPYQNT